MNEPEFDFSKTSDPRAFIKHLTERELYRLEKEEHAIDSARKELLKKYNDIVSARISHNILIDEVMKTLPSACCSLRDMLDEMDDHILQAILSVLKRREDAVE